MWQPGVPQITPQVRRWQAAIAATAAAEEAGSSAQHVAEVSARAAGVAAGLDWPFWADWERSFGFF